MSDWSDAVMVKAWAVSMRMHLHVILW